MRERGEVARGIEVPVAAQVARLTAVLAFGQAQLGFHHTTTRTRLGAGKPPVGNVHLHPGPVGFVLDLAA